MEVAGAEVRRRPALRCPVCKKPPLLPGDRSYVCRSGHAFDVAREGYVNLLLAHQKHSKEPGYDSAMMASRRRFLRSGAYDRLLKVLVEVVPAGGSDLSVLDAGCGEGYYLTGLADACRRSGTEVHGWGIDISKHGVRMAARRDRSCGWVVGNVFDLPVLDARFDGLISVFSPLAWGEFERAVAARGWVVVVGPGPTHLRGLKGVLYPEPEEFAIRAHLDDDAAFVLEERHRVQDEILVEGRDGVLDLLQMTPYYWAIPPEVRERALRLPSLQTPIDFDVAVYRKRA